MTVNILLPTRGYSTPVDISVVRSKPGLYKIISPCIDHDSRFLTTESFSGFSYIYLGRGGAIEAANLDEWEKEFPNIMFEKTNESLEINIS